jgi:hypothetical protein
MIVEVEGRFSMAEVSQILHSPFYFNNRPSTSTIITHVIITRQSKNFCLSKFQLQNFNTSALTQPPPKLLRVVVTNTNFLQNN